MRDYTVKLDEDAMNAVIEVAFEEGLLDDKIYDYIAEQPDTIIEVVANNNMYSEVAEEACESGVEEMVKAFMEYKMEAVITALSYNTSDLLTALVESDDNDIVEMLDKLVEMRTDQEDD